MYLRLYWELIISTLIAVIRETQNEGLQEGGKGQPPAADTVSWVGTHVRGERSINPRSWGTFVRPA